MLAGVDGDVLFVMINDDPSLFCFSNLFQPLLKIGYFTSSFQQQLEVLDPMVPVFRATIESGE